MTDPDQYDRFTYSECAQKHDGKCIDVNYGWKKNDEGKEVSEIQALRYKKSIWTKASAQSHCKSRGGTFTAAGEEDKVAKKELKMAKHYRQSPFKPRAKAGSYKIENKDDEATIYIYDEISWFGLSAEQLVKDINALKASTIHLRFNSPGGSVFDGTALFNAIKQHKSHTVTHIDGLAASIASVIALAANEVRMAENAFLMIHEPWSMVIGNADTMREEANLLDKVGGVIAKTYMDKTGKDEPEILEMMTAETWMTAEEAKEMGFVDVIDDTEEDEKAKATLFDLSVFANVPDQLKGDKQKPTARDLERILRDAGFSSKEAKAILAEGYKDDQRDADELESEVVDESQRDVEDEDQRDVEGKKEPKKKDRTAELLTRAEVMAPSNA